MKEQYTSRPTWAEIDLSALLHNLEQARSYCLKHQRLIAVVKANAYGHGAVPVAKSLKSAGVADFAAATPKLLPE